MGFDQYDKQRMVANAALVLWWGELLDKREGTLGLCTTGSTQITLKMGVIFLFYFLCDEHQGIDDAFYTGLVEYP